MGPHCLSTNVSTSAGDRSPASGMASRIPRKIAMSSGVRPPGSCVSIVKATSLGSSRAHVGKNASQPKKLFGKGGLLIWVVHPDILREFELADETCADHERRNTALDPILGIYNAE
jgi:hypothetical protein